MSLSRTSITPSCSLGADSFVALDERVERRWTPPAARLRPRRGAKAEARGVGCPVRTVPRQWWRRAVRRAERLESPARQDFSPRDGDVASSASDGREGSKPVQAVSLRLEGGLDADFASVLSREGDAGCERSALARAAMAEIPILRVSRGCGSRSRGMPRGDGAGRLRARRACSWSPAATRWAGAL